MKVYQVQLIGALHDEGLLITPRRRSRSAKPSRNRDLNYEPPRKEDKLISMTSELIRIIKVYDYGK